MSTRWIIGLLLAGTLLVPGCAKNPKPETGAITKVSEGDAQTLNAQHARFEHSEDPPIAVETRFAAGQLAEDQHNVPTAIAQYREALKLDPHHLPSLYRLGVIYTQIGAYPDALAAWKDYVDKTDGDAAAWANLGFCHELAGNPKEAETAYQSGIARDPKSNPCQVNYGLMLARAGRITEAILHLQAVLPEAQVHYNLGSVHEQQGRRDEARAEYRQAMQLDPTLTQVKARLAGLD